MKDSKFPTAIGFTCKYDSNYMLEVYNRSYGEIEFMIGDTGISLSEEKVKDLITFLQYNIAG